MVIDMGLDMYLEKVKKFDGMTLSEIIETNEYIRYLDSGDDCTFKEWCGGDINKVRKDKVDEVRNNIKEHFCVWDTEKKYGYKSVREEIAYWRKANQIHKWFVDNCADGVDECQVVPIDKADLEKLLSVAKKVLDASKLVVGNVNNGYRWDAEKNEEIPIIEKGKVIKDPTVAKKLLPTTSGFFFGGTSYDQWYYEDIVDTVKQLTKVLEETDFDNEYVYYQASW